MHDLAGKYAFITGASRGIGRAAALALAARGATVAIGYRKEAETAQALVAELEKAGGSGLTVRLDVGDPEQREAAFDRVAEKFGALDVYVANAAATAFKPLLDVKPHHVQKTFAITVDGFLFGVQRAARLMA